ncbi:hypothetical protein HK098_005938 [Nowakowskiella sp. JEL0407]|nr:hypothetical protein HK098_005938 [Nowakowskiella sp. JEL0407]
MSKRIANNQIHKDNPDDEDDEIVENPVFKAASQDQLQNRVIRKPPRRFAEKSQPSVASNEAQKPNPFAGFQFKPITSVPQPETEPKPSAPPSFNFGSAIGSSPIKFNAQPTFQPPTTSPFGKTEPAAEVVPVNNALISSMFTIPTTTSNTNLSSVLSDSRELEKFAKQLKGLNKSLIKNINDVVAEDAYIDLSDIIKSFGEQYVKHRTSIEQEHKVIIEKYGNPSRSLSSVEPVEASKPPVVSNAFRFQSAITAPAGTENPPASGISLSNGANNLFPSSTSTSGFNPFAGLKSLTPATNTGTSLFGSSLSTLPAAPSSTNTSNEAANSQQPAFSLFGNLSAIKPPASATTEAADGDGDDEPEPDPQLDPNTMMKGEGEADEDVLHETRCRLFQFQKVGGWQAIGVGVIRINKNKKTEKSRILMRADTSGRVLMNTLLFKAMNPQHSAGAKEFMMMSVIESSVDGVKKMVPGKMLIRTKTPKDAGDLFSVLEKEIKLLP